MEDTPQTQMLKKMILFFASRSKGHVTRFQLTKMLYLADLYAVKWTGSQLTGLDWRLYHYGPYADDINAALVDLEEAGRIQQRPVSSGRGHNIAVVGRLDLGELPKQVEMFLENVRKQCTSLSHDALYDFVYNTEPMLAQDVSAEEKAKKKRLDLSLERQKLLRELDEGVC